MTTLLQTKKPKGLALLFWGGGALPITSQMQIHMQIVGFAFFVGGEGALPMTSQIQIPVQIVISPLSHFGYTHTKASTTEKMADSQLKVEYIQQRHPPRRTIY